MSDLRPQVVAHLTQAGCSWWSSVPAGELWHSPTTRKVFHVPNAIRVRDLANRVLLNAGLTVTI